MKEKLKKGKITMIIVAGIVCFILALVMSMQFKVVNETDITSIESMRETELRTELANWKEKYEEVNANENIQGDYFLQVVGDSMIGDGIMEGSLAYVKQCNQVSNNSIAVVAIGDDEVTIKRVIQRPEVFILEASNPNVKARYFTYEEVESLPVRIIGKVLYVKTILD